MTPLASGVIFINNIAMTTSPFRAKIFEKIREQVFSTAGEKCAKSFKYLSRKGVKLFIRRRKFQVSLYKYIGFWSFFLFIWCTGNS
jgi:hypothetical protein